MLVLLSSGATPRYRDDIIRILALPAGADLQFRYDRRYIDPALLQKIEAGEVHDEKAIVLYLWSDRDKLHTEIVPCRFVNVVGIDFAGSSCIIRLRAENFATGLDDATFKATLTEGERSLLPRWEPKPEVGASLIGKFFFSIDDAKLSNYATNNLSAFEETAIALVRYKDFVEAPATIFFTVRRVIKIGKRGERLSGTLGPQPLGGSYQLLSGQPYQIEVYTFVPPKVELKTSKLHIDSSVSAVEFPLGHQVENDSRYDLKNFPFQVQEQIKDISTGLRIYVTGPDNQDARSDVLVPILFKGSLPFAIVRTAFIGIGTAGTGMVAANAAGKLDTHTGILICIFGLIAAVGTVFNSLRGG